MPNVSEGALARLVAVDAIHTVLARYCQAIDRCDKDLLKSVYWPDASDDHGNFKGNAMEFADFVMPFLIDGMDRTVHRLGNIDVNLLDEDHAKVQSYCLALHEFGGQEVIVATRFLDDFERRQDEWRLIHRTVVLDWNQSRPTASDWRPESMFSPMTMGRRDDKDPVHAWLAEPVGPRSY